MLCAICLVTAGVDFFSFTDCQSADNDKITPSQRELTLSRGKKARMNLSKTIQSWIMRHDSRVGKQKTVNFFKCPIFAAGSTNHSGVEQCSFLQHFSTGNLGTKKKLGSHAPIVKVRIVTLMADQGTPITKVWLPSSCGFIFSS